MNSWFLSSFRPHPEFPALRSQLAQGPFDAILGAALQFERWADRMWTVLRALTDDRPGATIALVHSVGSLGGPTADFEEVARVNGMRYGMHTAWDDRESDFELQILTRRQAGPRMASAASTHSEATPPAASGGEEECATS